MDSGRSEGGLHKLLRYIGPQQNVEAFPTELGHYGLAEAALPTDTCTDGIDLGGDRGDGHFGAPPLDARYGAKFNDARRDLGHYLGEDPLN
jgi:hypothetical protein